MFLTETWLKPETQSKHFSSFELQLFEIKLPVLVLCALVYRPPKFNKNFISDFSDFLAGLSLISDRFLIIGDFNIHVCCTTKEMTKEFLNVLDSFNLIQSVSEPTHEKGHTLDLVLSHGLDVSVKEICDISISDHLPILFTVTLPCSIGKRCIPARKRRILSPQTAVDFSVAFTASELSQINDFENVNELATSFDLTCTKILDSVAPFKDRRPKSAGEPWLNEETRALRRKCRQIERKCNKDKLQVSRIWTQNTENTQTECSLTEDHRADVLLLLDGFTNITSEDFSKVTEFLDSLVQILGVVGLDSVRFALVKCGERPEIEFDLNTYHDVSSVVGAVKNLSQSPASPGGLTSNDVDFLWKTIFMKTDEGGRDNAPDALIMISDRNSSGINRYTLEYLLSFGVKVLIVGVKEADYNALKDFGDNVDRSEVFSVQDVTDFSNILNELTQSFCRWIKHRLDLAPPESVKFSDVQSRRARVSWTYNGNRVQWFNVFIKSDSRGLDVLPHKRTTELLHLKPNTSYEIHIIQYAIHAFQSGRSPPVISYLTTQQGKALIPLPTHLLLLLSLHTPPPAPLSPLTPPPAPLSPHTPPPAPPSPHTPPPAPPLSPHTSSCSFSLPTHLLLLPSPHTPPPAPLSPHTPPPAPPLSPHTSSCSFSLPTHLHLLLSLFPHTSCFFTHPVFVFGRLEDFGQTEAEVVCRELDCGGVSELQRALFTEGSAVGRSFHCNGAKTALKDCESSETHCSAAANITCTDDVALRLSGDHCRGYLMLRHEDQWKYVKTVDQDLDLDFGSALCQQLDCGLAVQVSYEVGFDPWRLDSDCVKQRAGLRHCLVHDSNNTQEDDILYLVCSDYYPDLRITFSSQEESQSMGDRALVRSGANFTVSCSLEEPLRVVDLLLFSPTGNYTLETVNYTAHFQFSAFSPAHTGNYTCGYMENRPFINIKDVTLHIGPGVPNSHLILRAVIHHVLILLITTTALCFYCQAKRQRHL
ncbi:hypothetical protein WMY93_012522 [Mugilogobius chulae]|uniref:VWFA domain-containing protein n=1 Tax=Mugilogobius chulae TaxID=88201 RepID=A0AAW0PBB0_9GOBI